MPTPKVTLQDIRNAPLQPGEAVLQHRFCDVGEHIEDPACWCSPLVWTFADTRQLAAGEIIRRLNEFYCVH